MATVQAHTKCGRIENLKITTESLEFSYNYYEVDKAASLYIERKFSERHRRIVQAFIPPEVAEKLIEAFFTPPTKTEETEEWKHIYAIVEAVTANIAEVAGVKIGDDSVIKPGLTVTFGYRREPEGYYVYAEASWWNSDGVREKYSCRIYERDYVDAQDIKQSLTYFVNNVLDLVKICKT
jgi:hypothetical protein